jgi:voltage-gated potassium channel
MSSIEHQHPATSSQTSDAAELTLNEALSRCHTTRQRIYAYLLDPRVIDNQHQRVDSLIGLLIILNLFALVIEHIPSIFEPNAAMFHFFDVFSVAVFTLEYCTRLYLAPEDIEFNAKRLPRVAYVFSPFALIDFFAVAPFYFQAFIPIDLRVLRFLRLLRMLKLFRVLIPAYQEFKTLNENRTFRQKIHALVFPSPYGGQIFTMFENVIVWWVVISVIAVIFESVESIHFVLNTEFIIIDSVAVGLFSIEFFLKLYACVEEPLLNNWLVGRIRHSLKFSSIVDLLAILPFFLELFLHHLFDLRFLRIFRLMRLLKLSKQNNSTDVLKRVFQRETSVLTASLFIMMLMVVLAASLAYLFEHDSQPDKYENIPSTIYWAVITLSSVGYGDLTPLTPIGRLMTIAMAVIGVGIFAIPSALMAASFSDELNIDRNNLYAALYKRLENSLPVSMKDEFVLSEAERLNLSSEQIKGVVDKALYDYRVEQDLIKQPLLEIAQNTDQAVEHFVRRLSRIRQLGILLQQQPASSLDYLAQNLSPSECALWRQIQGSENFLKL